jgi:hypothetical protein
MTSLRRRAAVLAVLSTLLAFHSVVLWVETTATAEFDIPLPFQIMFAPLLAPTWAIALWWFWARADLRGGRALWSASFTTGALVCCRVFVGDFGWLELAWQPDLYGDVVDILRWLASIEHRLSSAELAVRALSSAALGAVAHAGSAWGVLRVCGADCSNTRLGIRAPLILAGCFAWLALALWWATFLSNLEAPGDVVSRILGPRYLILELHFLALGVRLYLGVKSAAHAMSSREHEPWVLLLRSFEHDALRVPAPPVGTFQWIVAFLFSNGEPPSRLIRRLRGRLRRNVEEMFTPIIEERFAPVVALGRPEDWIPTFGATRLYASNSDWQAHLRRLVDGARSVVVMPGFSEGLAWELRHLRESYDPKRVFVVIPPLIPGATERIDESWWLAARAFAAAGWVMPTEFPGFGSVLAFSHDWHFKVRATDSETVHRLASEVVHQMLMADLRVDPDELTSPHPAPQAITQLVG